MDPALLRTAAVAGFLGVALGAFGAHGLEARFEGLEDAAQRLEWWATAAQYHLIHALAIGLAAAVRSPKAGAGARGAGGSFALGILLFSGSLYVMSLTGIRTLGAVTPLGGVFFLVGWIALFRAAGRQAA